MESYRPVAMDRDFRLYEALLWEPPEGYFLLDRHLERLAASAAHFAWQIDIAAVQTQLLAFAEGLGGLPRKVRLELSASGHMTLEDVGLPPARPARLALAQEPVDSHDVFLRHKTSRREVYERARAQRTGADDVLLWNERHELTEACSANVIVELEGRRWTPPLESGLLPGTYRAYLLSRGELEERVLPIESLERASAIFLINSVRRLWPGHLDSGDRPKESTSERREGTR